MKARTILSHAPKAWPWRLTVHGHALRRLRVVALCLSMAFAFAAVGLGATAPAAQAANTCSRTTPCPPITGAGSTWAYNAIHAWNSNMVQFGVTVNYQNNGSSSGRRFFADGQADWAASEIPYGVVDGANTDSPPSRHYVYVPDVAGGTTFMYNLQINGRRVTNLRLSGKTAADIFTNKITFWDNQEIKADNPQLALPHQQIIPVVRSDGSGATADFTQWMLATNPSVWRAYCAVTGRTPCTQTSTYPVQQGTAMIAQSGDPGVATYVAQASSNGAIGYVEYSWALQENFPVAKLLNAAGYYTLPSPGHVAVSLLKDQINTSNPNDPATYLTQNLAGVYTNTDHRNYELSAYSYFILPTDLSNGMTTSKGFTLGTYGSYALCAGQSQVDVLGYSALPINLAEAGFTQLAKIPGASVPSGKTAVDANCHNPTFSTNGTNTLAVNDPQPLPCDKVGSTQCAPGQVEPGETGVSSNVTGGTTGNNGTTGGPSGHGATNGATPGSTATTGTGKNCDPNTGVCSPTAGSTTGTNGTGTTGTTGNSEVGNGSTGSGQAVGDTPLTLAASNGSGLEVTLMALAAGMMFLVSAVPPLLAQAGRRSRQRRGIDEFYEGNDRTGDRK